jgi:hypothetical protein
VCIATIVELTARILWTYRMNNLFVYHFFIPIEFFLLAILYRHHFDGFIPRSVISFMIIAFTTFAIINTIFFQGLLTFNSNASFVECIVMIVLAMIYFYKLLRDLKHKNLERVPMVWINMSVLTYFSGALMLFYVSNELVDMPPEDRVVVWGTHAVFNVVHYALYAVALLVKAEKKINIA